MFDKVRFYFRHSFNDLQVNRRLTFFALLAIGAGVAAIVSLQTLAVMIGDTLEGNLQETNRGDISVSLDGDHGMTDDEVIDQGVDEGILSRDETTIFGSDFSEVRISTEGLAQIQEWIDSTPYAGQVEMTYRVGLTNIFGIFTSTGTGTTVTLAETGEQVTSVSPIMIEADAYPYYGEIIAQDAAVTAVTSNSNIHGRDRGRGLRSG